MHTLLIFAGAGASKAVNPDQYPTTVEFFEALSDEIKNDPLFVHVEAFLRETLGNQRLDIELVLWRLQELKIFCENSLRRDQFSGWMIQTGRFALVQPSLSIGHFPHIANMQIEHLSNLISKINRKVYDLYAELPDEKDLARTWNPLLEGCAKLGIRTEIVTTNYDLIIESALDSNAVADNGWRGTVVRKLEIDAWTPISPGLTQRGMLTKLHGSVNWSRNNETIYVSDPTFKGKHENHVIIYPGFKGRPSDGAFLNFHEHFRRSLMASKVVIFIGFAFRDAYINEICDSSITSGTTCIVINPQAVRLPFTNGKAINIESPFDAESVKLALEHANDALNAS
jgi:hypothetical protein